MPAATRRNGQSSEALQEMLKDPDFDATGPDQEAAMRAMVCPDFDFARAYLRTIDDQAQPGRICGPWYYADDQRWAYERTWYDD